MRLNELSVLLGPVRVESPFTSKPSKYLSAQNQTTNVTQNECRQQDTQGESVCVCVRGSPRGDKGENKEKERERERSADLGFDLAHVANPDT